MSDTANPKCTNQIQNISGRFFIFIKTKKMKKLFLSCFIIVIALHANAQVPQSMEIQKQKFILISPSEEVNIRNNLSTLKVQSVQLCDSVALLQQKINDSMKELQSKGVSDESAKAIAVQKQLDRISKMLSMLSNLSKKMHETSLSIIQNMK